MQGKIIKLSLAELIIKKLKIWLKKQGWKKKKKTRLKQADVLC